MLPSQYGLGIVWKGSPNYNNTSTTKKFIVVHWSVTADLVGIDETFRSTAQEVSAHYAVGGTDIHQYVDENYIAWHAGDKQTNRDGLGIQNVGGTIGANGVRVPPSDETLRTSGKLIGRLHREWSLGRPVQGVTIRKHNEFSSTECPGTTDMGRLTGYAQVEYDRLADQYPNRTVPKAIPPTTRARAPMTTPPVAGTASRPIDVRYRVRTVSHDWLPEVNNLDDYAGWQDSPLTGLAIAVSAGMIEYQVHTLGGSWLPLVTGYDLTDAKNGYAGLPDGQTMIDAIRAYLRSPLGDQVIAYRVAPVGQDYCSWQRDSETSNGQNGYAGLVGTRIGRFQAHTTTYQTRSI